MIALGIIFAVILLLTLTRVGINVIYDGSLTLRLIIGPVRFVLSSRKEKQGKEKRGNTAENTQKPKQAGEKKKSPWPRILLSHWRELLELISRVLSMPLLNPFILKVTFGGADPAAGAVNYGRAWAAVGAVMPLLESRFQIGKREIDVDYDENTSNIKVYFNTSLTARIGQCLRLAVAALILFFKLYQETKQSEKAVRMK